MLGGERKERNVREELRPISLPSSGTGRICRIACCHLSSRRSTSLKPFGENMTCISLRDAVSERSPRHEREASPTTRRPPLVDPPTASMREDGQRKVIKTCTGVTDARWRTFCSTTKRSKERKRRERERPRTQRTKTTRTKVVSYRSCKLYHNRPNSNIVRPPSLSVEPPPVLRIEHPYTSVPRLVAPSTSRPRQPIHLRSHQLSRSRHRPFPQLSLLSLPLSVLFLPSLSSGFERHLSLSLRRSFWRLEEERHACKGFLSRVLLLPVKVECWRRFG